MSVRALRDIEQGRVRRPRWASVRRLAAVVGLDLAAAAPFADQFHAGPARTDGGLIGGGNAGSRPARVDTAGARGLRVGVLGPLLVHRGPQVVVGPLMQRCLLGLLALQPNQPVGHEEIIDVLWGEDPPPTCHSLVRGYVARLRRLLEPAPARGTPDRVLATVGGGYVLALSDGALDVLRFDTLVAQAHKARVGNAELALELYGQAFGCWRGPVLADLSSRLRQHPAAVAVWQRRVTATLAFADLALEQGEHQRAAAQLHGLVAVEPLHEGLHARLMLALAGAGQQAAALELFARLRERLVGDLGVEPGAEVQEAQARVLHGDLPGVRASGRKATAGAASRPWPAMLPADVAGFTGRAGQLEQLDALLDAGDGESSGTAVVISAVAGTAGVGKTALAVHWAHRVADRFPDGQLYINLQGYAAGPPLAPMQALAGLLRALGVTPEEIPAEPEQAAGLYRSLLADRRVLVVLDNAHSAEQVRPLLPGSAGCVVVVTSRDRLTGLVATHGAQRFTLEVLTPEEAVTLLERVLGPQRVAAEQAAAQVLAEECGWLPLALRIAAANLTGRPEQSIAGYVAELRGGDRLGGLEVAGDPQAAVRVAFDHSYDRLSPDGRRLFRLLGLVPGPQVSAAGAAALAELPVQDARRLLGELVDAHLVEPRGADGYGLHDLLGVYARQRAESEDGRAACEAALGRLLDWYLHGIDSAAELLYGEVVRLPAPPAAPTRSPVAFSDPLQAAAWLEAELANLVAAILHAAAHGPQTAAWLLADALRGYFWQRRPMAEWLLVGQAGLDAATAAGDVRATAAGHLSLGLANRAAGRSQPARQHLTTAITLARQSGWTNGQAAALGGHGQVAYLSGDLQRAADDQAEALGLYRRSGWLGGQADSLFDLGLMERALGRLHQAAERQTQALRLYRRLGSRIGEVTTLGSLGEIDHELGRRLEAARGHLTSALRLYQELGLRFGQAFFLRALAALNRDTGHTQEALSRAQDALRLAGDIGDRSTQARAEIVLASIHLQLGRPHAAGDHYQHTLELAQELASRVHEADARLGLADVWLALDQPHRALDAAHQALRVATHAGMRLLQGHAHTTLAAVHHRLTRRHQALTHAHQALKTHRHTGHRLGAARALHVLGRTLRATGDLPAATRCWQEALEVFTDIGSPQAHETRKLLDA